MNTTKLPLNEDALKLFETRRNGLLKSFITIPEPDAFNGAVLPVPGGYTLFYRNPKPRQNTSSCALLTKDFAYVRDLALSRPLMLEDIRTIKHNGEYWLSGNRCSHIASELRIAVSLLRFSLGRDKIRYDWYKPFTDIKGWPEYTHKIEKNWLPFSADGKLLFVYSMNPHIILEVDPEAGVVTRKWLTAFKDSPWPITGTSKLAGVHSGRDRGHFTHVDHLSTPPVRLRNGDYLSMFHSRQMTRGFDVDHWSGAYVFSGRPPYQVLAVSDTPILTPYDADRACPIMRMRGRVRLLFIQTLLLHEAANKVLLIGGEADSRLVKVELKLSDIMATLRPVTADPSAGMTEII